MLDLDVLTHRHLRRHSNSRGRQATLCQWLSRVINIDTRLNISLQVQVRNVIDTAKTTEAQHHNQFRHVSSGTTTRGCPTGIHPVHAQMDAFNKTRAGGVWRPPSGNPSMLSHYTTQDVRAKPYKTDRAARALRKKHIHKTDLSVHQIPITASGSRLI